MPYQDPDSPIGRIKRMPKKTIWIILGVIIFLIYLASSIVSIPPQHVGVVFVKIGKAPAIEGRFIVEKGYKGYQREVLLPGFHLYWLADRMWRIDIEKHPMVNIQSQHIGLVEALDGTPLPEGQILAKDDSIEKTSDGKEIFHMGQKGPRETVLTPGFHPVNPRYLKVTEQRAIIIEQGKIGIVTKRVGDDPPSGMILVSKDDGYKGIQREVLVPGTYYFNPLAVNVEIEDAVVIEKGKVGVITKKVGKEPPAGTILVSRDAEFQGIQREVLQPGMYYINPYEKAVKIVPAIEIPDGHVGVQIAKTGEDKPADQLLAKPGQRGILEDILSPGIYYLNPFEYDVIVFDTRQQRYEMSIVEGEGERRNPDAINFLSDDGFNIIVDLTVLWQIRPEDTPYVVATVDRNVNAVAEKIIRAAARSFGRIIGSMNKGEEFVHGFTRQKFQDDLHNAMASKCLESKIQINQTLIRHFEVPKELLDPITKKVIALKQQQQYEQEQSTQKANAELERQTQLVVFQSEKVKSETDKMKASIMAEQQRDVEQTLVAKKKFEAEGDATKVKITADASLYAAEKEAAAIRAKILGEKLAQAEGQKKLVDAWSGEGARFIVANEIAKRLEGAKLLPLELFFGGSGGKDGSGVIRHQDNLELLKLLKIIDIDKQLKDKPAPESK